MRTGLYISTLQLLHVHSGVTAIDGFCHNCETVRTFKIVLGTEWAASRRENTCSVFALLVPSKEHAEEEGISGEKPGEETLAEGGLRERGRRGL